MSSEQASDPSDVARLSTKRLANDVMRERLAFDNPDPIAFYCECDNPRCFKAVWLTATEYDHARSDPTWEAVVEQHRGGQSNGGWRAPPA